MQLLTPSLQLNKRAHQFLDCTEFPVFKNSSSASAKIIPLIPCRSYLRRRTSAPLLHDHRLRYSIEYPIEYCINPTACSLLSLSRA